MKQPLGPARPRRVASVVIAALLLLAATSSTPGRATGGGWVVTTMAGSVGSGPASSVAFAPRGLVVRGSELLIADHAWDVIRAVDLASGQTRVLAGTGFEGAGADGVGTEVQLKDPYGIAVDGQGSIYFTEPSLHRVRRLGTDNRLTTVAGTGSAGFSGDGGPATQARLNGPIDVAVDAAGTVYITDTLNNRVRRVTGNGSITTIAGTGEQGFSGDGGPAVLAKFDTPEFLAADSTGNLFVTDQQLGRRVRRINAAGIVATVAGGGTGTESSGTATSLQLDIARDVEPDGAGGFYVSGIYSVTHVSLQGQASRYAGNGYWPQLRGEPNGDGGPATAAQLWSPEGLARTSAGDVYIADSGNARIRRVNGNGVISSVAGTGDPLTGGDGGPAVRGQLEWPGALEFDGRGSLLFTDNAFIRSVAPDGTLATLVGHPHRSPCPSDGASPRSVSCAGPADRNAEGRLFFTEPQGFRVWTVGPDGVVHPFAGTAQRGSGGDGGAALATPLDYPVDIEVAPSGDVYFLESNGTAGNRVRRVDQSGIITTVAGGGTEIGEGVEARAAALLASSFDLAADGSIYLVEPDLHRVRRVGPDGRIGTVAGTGRRGRGDEGVAATASDLNDPRHVAVAPDGAFFVSDSGNHRVRRVAVDGTITTVAGRGSAGFSGDGGNAVDAEFNFPTGLAVGADGAVFVADTLNRRIRRIAQSVAGGGVQPPPGSGGGGSTAGTPSPVGSTARSGYWMLDAAGSVYAFGNAGYLGGAPIRTEAVDIEPVPAGGGYWILEASGSVHGLGVAARLGPGPALVAGESATSLSATPSGAGYWIFTTRGRVFAYGDAVFHGDMAGRALNAPVLDSVPTPNGAGYYMVSADGGIFAFGNARFAGSMGGRRLNAPVQSLVPDRDGVGYWLVASDGGIFAFDAPFRGSLGGMRLNRPITGMVRFGDGYLMVGEDGGIFNFSDRVFHGSLGDRPPARPITSVAALEG